MATIKSIINDSIKYNRFMRRREKAITGFLTEIRENASQCFRGYGYIIQYLNKKWIVSEDNKNTGRIRTVKYRELKKLLLDSYYI